MITSSGRSIICTCVIRLYLVYMYKFIQLCPLLSICLFQPTPECCLSNYGPTKLISQLAGNRLTALGVSGLSATLTRAKSLWPNDWISASPDRQGLWGAPGQQWWVPTERGPKKETPWSDNSHFYLYSTFKITTSCTKARKGWSESNNNKNKHGIKERRDLKDKKHIKEIKIKE